MPRYKLTLEYDGTPFVGWQMQENGPSVQGRLAQAIKAFSGDDAIPRGAGRTDAGVHALGQVAHVDLVKDWPPATVRNALNAVVRPDPISVLACDLVGEDFDARFSAKARHYLYRIVDRRAPLALDRERAWGVFRILDADAMEDAAEALIGHHDFTTFRSTECQAASPVKTLDRLDVERDGEARELLRTIVVKFDGGPVGLSTLAVSLGEEPDTIEDVYEPYLLQLGFIQRTPRGRTITKLGREHLGTPEETKLF